MSKRQSDGLGNLPQLYDIFNGEVANVQAYGAFVKIPGCRKQGLVHKTQLSSVRIDDPTEMLAKGENVWCKVISMEEDGEKISLSMKVVNQTTGKDLDPNNVQASLDERKRRTWNFKGNNKIELGAELNTTCRKCGGHGHMAIDCFVGKGNNQYGLIPDLENLTDLLDPEDMKSISQPESKIKKKKKEKKKDKKKKKKREVSESSYSSDYQSSEEEKKHKRRKRVSHHQKHKKSYDSSSESDSDNEIKRKGKKGKKRHRSISSSSSSEDDHRKSKNERLLHDKNKKKKSRDNDFDKDHRDHRQKSAYAKEARKDTSNHKDNKHVRDRDDRYYSKSESKVSKAYSPERQRKSLEQRSRSRSYDRESRRHRRSRSYERR